MSFNSGKQRGVPRQSPEGVHGQWQLHLVPGSHCSQGSDEDAHALGGEIAAYLSALVTLSPSPKRLALDHAVRIRFSHSSAVKLVFMMIVLFKLLIMEICTHTQK